MHNGKRLPTLHVYTLGWYFWKFIRIIYDPWYFLCLNVFGMSYIDVFLNLSLHFSSSLPLYFRTHGKAALGELISNKGFEAQLRRHIPPETLRNVSKIIEAVRTLDHWRKEWGMFIVVVLSLDLHMYQSDPLISLTIRVIHSFFFLLQVYLFSLTISWSHTTFFCIFIMYKVLLQNQIL